MQQTPVGETALAKGFCSDMGNRKYPSQCLQKNEATWKGCT